MSRHFAGRPPVRIEPFPDESIASMLHRLAHALGTNVDRFLSRRSQQRLFVPSAPADLRPAADLLGISVERLYREHTVALRGEFVRAGRAVESLDRIRGDASLGCPSCRVGSLWTALVPVTSCTACGTVLVPLGDLDRVSGQPNPTRAPIAARDLQATYLRVQTTPDAVGTARLTNFNRFLTHMLRTRRAEHEPVTAVTAPSPGIIIDSSAHSRWDSPASIARYATRAWAGCETQQGAEDLIWQTVRQRSPLLSARNGGSELHELHELLRSGDLSYGAIPPFVHSGVGVIAADAFDLDLGYAIGEALRAEFSRAMNVYRLWRRVPEATNGERPLYRRYLTHTPAGIGCLTRQASQLITSDNHDRGERAAILSHLRRVPARLLTSDKTEAAASVSVAAAWIQVQLTQNPLVLRGGAHRLRDVKALDASLDPEARLALLAYGLEYLGAVTDDVERAAASTKRGAMQQDEASDVS